MAVFQPPGGGGGVSRPPGVGRGAGPAPCQGHRAMNGGKRVLAIGPWVGGWLLGRIGKPAEPKSIAFPER